MTGRWLDGQVGLLLLVIALAVAEYHDLTGSKADG